ncbi:restriction endonuclease subunit S [Amphritea balenae]|uniref:Restriction endonuclease subunit S n=1 Tax=Amphritea balenae TaxID=452629 RepID=A0A3P1SVU6_9GAMM|nr:restriction endonuclease subunit S [Amphritea balenae]RRD01332.1 restriction endonuclease subunit S [Amphritea balenae]GGK58016.1 hypothetical protein GCM10007941_05220 [Amphritea balenae]
MESSWESYRLGDITEWSSGGTPSKSKEQFWGGSIPWISASSMDGNRYSNSKLKITDEGLGAGSRLAKENSILLLVRGSILHQKIQVGIAERDVAFNQDVKALSVNVDYVEPWYLLFWFIANEQKLLAMVENTGIGAGKLDTKLLQNLEINVPPYNERLRILEFAKAVDDKIELNRQINQTLEQMAQSLFKSWFVDFDPVIDNALDAGNPIPETMETKAEQRRQLRDAVAKGEAEAPELPDNIRSLFPSEFEFTEEMGWIPKGWQLERLDNVLELRYGKALKKSDRIEGEFPVYGSGGLNGSHNESLVMGPGVIVGRKGTVGSLYWEDKSFYPIDTVFYVQPKSGYSLEYCYYLLQTLGLQDMNTDAAVPGLNRNNAYRLLSCSPSKEVMNTFTQHIQAISQKRDSNVRNVDSLTTVRGTLLPKLISGELQIPEAEQQVAEALN